ncbi:MAG: hypothetical protein HYV09_36125 [Deltaproteobacteria bacterium]|nr:hypothetical protein [Deltaproteobacteria bacterium]
MTTAATTTEVFRRVLLPAITGGELVIERPFGPKAARAAGEAMGLGDRTAEEREVDRMLSTTTLERGDEALLRRLRRLTATDAVTISPRIDGSVVWLGALLHDVVAAFHPDLPGVFRRRAPHQLLEATAVALEEVPAPPTVRSALLRHAWLGDLPRFSLLRTELRWWVGGASFVGKEPPRRLLAWPEVRRVRRDDRTVEILRLPELFADNTTTAIGSLHARAMAAFLAATPLTDLMMAGRLSPPFQLTEAAAHLIASPAGARLARRAIALGEEGGKFAREVLASVGGAAAAALA